MDSELYLIAQIKAGDESAFEALFNSCYPMLCVHAKKLVGDLDKAREIAQGVFVKLYENRQQLVITTSVQAYLFQSVHNSCLNYLKQEQTHNRHHQYISYTTSLADETDVMMEMELEERLLQAISALPQQCQRIFKMNRFEGKTNKEIAQELALSIRTVETQISKALRLLREALADLFTLLLPLALIFT
ncbi:MAG: RNA polymerase sigma-70 factor [Bacteroidota bacterium]